MAEIRIKRVEQGQTKIKNVPIAVTPEGFWCCPSPVVFQKTLKAQATLNKPKSSSSPPLKVNSQKKQTSLGEKISAAGPTRLGETLDDQRACASDSPGVSTPVVPERPSRPKVEHIPRKVAIEFGEPGTSDMKIILFGKQGFCVKLSVHKKMLAEHSRFFADKISEQESCLSCFEINECEDVEIYVETVGLMYCKDMKQRLIKQSVQRVLRILKVAESLGFNSCISSCLEYLEAVPWVGEEEEEKVLSSVLQLQTEGVAVDPVLKRVSSEGSYTHKDTISHVMELVLSSSGERGRREMKAIVLKLLKENSNLPSRAGSDDICNKTIYASCRDCLSSLVSLFKEAAESDLTSKSMDNRESVSKQIALQADNLSWLLEILLSRQSGDEYAQMWANQKELAFLHSKLPTMSRYHVSCITSRIFVGIGKGELLPVKETRQLLLHTWLQPLINDYSWLQHGCRTFERKVVEEGIGRTILTLPLEDQQTILLGWLGSFLKAGDNCPNLQRAFEVWWRRAFVRPYGDPQGHSVQSHSSTASKS